MASKVMRQPTAASLMESRAESSADAAESALSTGRSSRASSANSAGAMVGRSQPAKARIWSIVRKHAAIKMVCAPADFSRS